ncbi:hypothetical protein VTK73DRAFT_7952 [Phialemonium thermophilum]|uniref:DNA replication regulator Sld3 C-terminal domain-containing protein n=1 Tax=Phialemonium thermophilum TaxID=223376 RepID=A0ABR3XSI4_9PEZI
MSVVDCPSSDATRPKSGILTPTSDGSLNSHDRSADDGLPTAESRKRKRDTPGLPMESLLRPAIVVKPHRASLVAKPRILHPLMLLPREHLPLSSFDLALPHGDFSPCRFYESQIKILDLEGRLGSNVLLARSETKQTVYALERQDNGLYVLCKLGSWVDVGRLAQQATVTCRPRILAYSKDGSSGESAPAPLTTPHLHKVNKKRKLAIEEIQSMLRKRARSQSLATAVTDSQAHDTPSSLVADASATMTPEGREMSGSSTPSQGLPPQSATQSIPQTTAEVAPQQQPTTDDALSQLSAEDIFQNIRKQYADVLYHSMSPLSYFVKGTLSRARAAFHVACDDNLEMGDLIEFLKSLVMNTVLIDKKYRETIPEIIAKMKTFVDGSDEDGSAKKRKPKKVKLGKDGLYPQEEEQVRRWWNSKKLAGAESSDKSASPEEIRYHVSCLRRRETQLQMILIFQILALELNRPTEAAGESQLPRLDSQKPPEAPVSDAPTKKRNKHNLPVLLDVHADRLCIWQSTTLDDVKALAESQISSHSQQTDGGDQPNSDPLKDFCVDVIIPFFSAHLPDLCDSISRKLGGPVIKSLSVNKQARQVNQYRQKAAGSSSRKPSAPSKDKGKTLEQVLSNERMRRSVSRGPTDAIALMRSASTAMIPGLKKETSDTLLGTVPRNPSLGSVKEKSTTLLFGTKASGVTSLAAGSEDLKAKKKALVDAELKDAISALKKPNRALAVRDIVEAAERRASTGQGQLKKAKKPAKISAVQVKATPVNSRFRDALFDRFRASEGKDLADLDVHDGVPFSSLMVPSSAGPKKRASSSGTLLRPADDVARPGDVQVTPIRRRSVQATVPSLADDGPFVLSSSPLAARKAPASKSIEAVAENLPPPPRPTSATTTSPPLDDLGVLKETPVKAARPPPLPGTSREKALSTATAELSKQLTIYQQLGWDDEDVNNDL